MATRNDVAFVWVEEKGEPRPGDVVFKCEDGKRLSVRPIPNCSRCDGKGRVYWAENGKQGERLCQCIRDISANQIKKTVKHTVDYSLVGLREQAFIMRLEEEIAKLKGERDGLVAATLKRADALEALAVTQRAEVAAADTTIAGAKATLETLEANRKPMLAQMDELRKTLAANADAIEAQKTLIANTSQNAKLALTKAAEHDAYAAAMRGGDYGERAEKLARAISKREKTIAETRAKLTPPAAVPESQAPPPAATK